jgi:hypothetical protein
MTEFACDLDIVIHPRQFWYINIVLASDGTVYNVAQILNEMFIPDASSA